ERAVRDLAGDERFEFREHRFGVVPRALGEIEFRKPVGAVAVFDEPDLFDVELRAVLFVLGERGPHLEELPDLPRLRLFKERRIFPDGDRADGSARVAELAGDERLAVARGAAALFGELYEAIDIVARLKLRQLRQHRLLGFGHGETLAEGK